MKKYGDYEQVNGAIVNDLIDKLTSDRTAIEIEILEKLIAEAELYSDLSARTLIYDRMKERMQQIKDEHPRRMDNMHILYTDKKGNFRQVDVYFKTLADAEKWLIKIKARYWEIGV